MFRRVFDEAGMPLCEFIWVDDFMQTGGRMSQSLRHGRVNIAPMAITVSATLVFAAFFAAAYFVFRSFSKPPAVNWSMAPIPQPFLELTVERAIVTRTETGLMVELFVNNDSSTSLHIFSGDLSLLLQAPRFFYLEDAQARKWVVCAPAAAAPAAESSPTASQEVQALPPGALTRIVVTMDQGERLRLSGADSENPSNVLSPAGAQFTIRGMLTTSYSDSGDRVDLKPRGTGPCELIGFDEGTPPGE